MKTIDIENLKQEMFPKEVVKAYGQMCDAQIKFGVVCLQHTPEPPLKEGDKLLIDNTLYAIVELVRYRPYSNYTTIGAWSVHVKPVNKDFTEQKIHRNNFPLSGKMNIKLLES